jgi:hypothetical protein
MPSMIDVTKPQQGEAETADVRANFQVAANEISALQDTVDAAANTGTQTIGSGVAVMLISVGEGAPSPATPGFDKIGSLYTDATGTIGAALYCSGGDGTWAAIG